MVNAFSEYARTPRMEVSRFDVNALITELCDLYAHQEKPLAIKLALAPESAADRGRRRPLAASAAQSAAQRARSDGASRRAARGNLDAPRPECRLRFRRDQGRGQRAGLSRRHRASSVRAVRHEQAEGNGLGLAIVKKLVEEHGGQINARNREQGGAEISILIPMSVDAGGQSLNRRHDHRRERA